MQLSKNCIARPSELAEDDTPMWPVIRHAVDVYERETGKHVDAAMTLQPTSPLRTYQDITDAIELFEASGKDSLYSGYFMGIKGKEPYDKHKAVPHFQRNGAIFITRRDLLDSGKLWSDEAIGFEMPESRSVDIDTLDQMKIAEALIRYAQA